MNNDARCVEEHTANVVVTFTVMLAILSTAENGIEQGVGIGRCSRHFGHRLHAAGIWASSSTKIGLFNVIVTSIRLAVGELVATVGERRVLEIAPQLIDLLGCELHTKLRS